MHTSRKRISLKVPSRLECCFALVSDSFRQKNLSSIDYGMLGRLNNLSSIDYGMLARLNNLSSIDYGMLGR